MSSEIVINLNNVSKKYVIYNRPIDRLIQYLTPKETRFQEFSALYPLSLSIKKGSTVGIVGKNGSGKSTLLQMIAGTLSPTTGSIDVTGRVSALLELGAGFNPEFTGRENVYLNASILGIPYEEVKNRFKEILEFSEIEEFIDRPVKTYSSGMFVRLAFSVATLIDPDVVIIDEALSVGDEKFQRKCYNHLEKLKENGSTILFVSHSMKTVEQLCDYAYLLDSGRLIAEGEPKKIIDQYHLMLYAQENDHIKVLNQTGVQEQDTPIEVNSEKRDEPQSGGLGNNGISITDIKMFKLNGDEAYLYGTGEESEIVLKVFSHIIEENAMIGLRVKTTHGVEVYGTSTVYHDIEIGFGKNKEYKVSFKQKLDLAPGIYHVSVAIAKKVGNNDMIYYDKLSDHILFKIEQSPLRCTGIADLNTNIHISEV